MSSSRLTEFNPTGTSSITAGNSLQLGTPFVPSVPASFGQVVGEDVSFQYAAPGQGTVQGIVEYTGPRNNPVLTIDPTTGGAAIQNESPFFNVALEGYSIGSTSGRLLAGDAAWHTGRRESRSTGTRVRREAERLAARWEAKLREGRYKAPFKAAWAEFRERFETEKGSSLSENTRNSMRTAFNHWNA